MERYESNLRKSALNYLRDENILSKIESMAIRHAAENPYDLNSAVPPLIVELELNFPTLFNESQELYTLLETNCIACWNLFQEVVNKEIFDLMIAAGKKPPIRIQLMMYCIPFTPRTLPTTTSLTALFALHKRVLVAKTAPVKYNICTRFRCPDNNCIGHAGQYKMDFELRDPSHSYCRICTSKMLEDVRGRGEGERLMASFLPILAFKNNLGRYDPFLVSVTGRLTNDLELGVEYDLVGRHEGRWFELWGIQRTVTSPLAIQPYFLPESIQKLRNDLSRKCPKSPWALVATLSSQLCCGTCPAKSYRHLKMGLLLSLASTASDFPIPIMCIGPDTWGAEELFRYAAKLAPRYLPVTYPVGGSITGDNARNNVKFAGGCFIMTRTGVCSVEEWSTLRPTQSKAILSVIDNGSIAMESNSITPVRAMCPELPLRTAIWTYWRYSRTKRDQQTLNASISVFGVPFLSDSQTDDDIVTYTLNNAINCSESKLKDVESAVRVDHFEEFLRYVNVINVTWTTEAAQLSNDYFVACRRARGDCLPIRSIKTINALAESHTKLSLRIEVTEADVIPIIALYEESLCYLYGARSSSTPPNCFNNVNIEANDKTMSAFNVWLRDYLKQLIIPGGRSEE